MSPAALRGKIPNSNRKGDDAAMKAKQIIERVMNGIFTLVEAICRLALLFMACTVTAQVIARALGGNIRWCEEIMLFMLDGLMFMLLPIGIKDDLHIRVEVFAKLCSKKVRKALVVFADLVMLLVSVCMIYFGNTLMSKTFSKLNVTGIPKKYLYLFTVVSGVLCSIVLIVKLCGMYRTQSAVDFIEGADSMAKIAEEKEA